MEQPRNNSGNRRKPPSSVPHQSPRPTSNQRTSSRQRVIPAQRASSNRAVPAQRSLPNQRSSPNRAMPAQRNSSRAVPAQRVVPAQKNSYSRINPASDSKTQVYSPDEEFQNVEKPKPKPKKKRSPFFTFLRNSFIVFIFLFFTGLAIGAGAYLGIIKSAPELEMLAIEPNVYTSIIYDMNGQEIDRFHGDENREYVTLDNIPIYLQDAIISIEDARFYKHNGVDFKGVVRAAYVTIKNKLGGGSRLEGASTITQQLIKNNVTKVTRNSIKTKIQEQHLAVEYEKHLEKQLGSKRAAKNYILELYLNTIGLNHGYSGVQAASLGYFNKDVSELDLAESACIAGITNNPSYYTPRVHPENNEERKNRILKNMLEQGYISNNEYLQAKDEDIYSRVSDSTNTQQNYGNVIHNYFVDSLFEQISNDLQTQYKISSAQANNYLYNSGLQIYSTFDPNIQQIVDNAYLNDNLFPDVAYNIEVAYTVSIENKTTKKQSHNEYKVLVKNREAADNFIANKKAEIENALTSNEGIIADKAVYTVEPQSAMVIIDYRTGEIKALSGGRGEKLVNRGFNRAVDSARQPGSVFKVLAAFAPGIDMGKLTASTVFDDVPYTIGDYSPKNWYTNPPYRGLSTIREGTRDSMNVIAVKAMVYTGVDSCYDYLLNFGFTTLKDDNHASTALGGLTRGVTQLEVTAAFGAIANGGAYKRPMFYSKVLDHDGNLLLQNTQESKQVLKKTTSYVLTNMMQDVVKSGTGTAAQFKSSQMPVAGKTGTSQESRDLTFVGYTPYYVAGVWLGYDNYDDTVKNMSNINQSTHTNLWRTVMEQVHQNLPVKNFEQPEGIVSASICTESGKLAGKLCGSDPRGTIRSEFFAEGTQPTDYCNVHKAVSICKASGGSPSSYCPSSSIVSSVGIVRPEPYNGSEAVADKEYEVGKFPVCSVHTGGGGKSNSGEGSSKNQNKRNDDENPAGEAAEGQENSPDSPQDEEPNAPSAPSAPNTSSASGAPASDAPSKPEASIGEVVPSVPEEPPAQPVMPDMSAAGVPMDGFMFD